MSVSTEYDYSVSTVQQREAEKKNSEYGTSSTDFLQLLIAQLTNQDPLNPMEDMDFTSQLAQLQALEEQMAMTKSINAMRMDSQVQSGTNMIGREVTGVNTLGESVTGTVVRVLQTADDIYVELAGGSRISVSSVTQVSGGESSLADDLAASANYIGMWVEAGYDAAMQPIQGIVESIVMENGEVMLKMYGGSSVSWKNVTSMRSPTDDELWYTYPDDVRKDIEKAQSMLGMTVTGTSSEGQVVTGIVADAKIATDNSVYLVLFDGTVINVQDVEGEASEPTAEDIARDLAGLWAVGLDEQGNSIEGLVAGAEDRDDGVAIILSDGRHIYLDSLTEITDPPEDAETGSGGDATEESAEETGGAAAETE